MKKILSIIACKKSNISKELLIDEIEFLNADDEKSCAENIKSGIKQCKGKYALIIGGDLTLLELQPFLSEVAEASDDIIIFNNGYCFKSSVLKGLNIKDGNSKFITELSAVFDSKNVFTLGLTPFAFSSLRGGYSEDVEAHLLQALDEFNKNKAKLTKDVYTFAFDMICSQLSTFYLSAILAVRNKQISAEHLIDFDTVLKQHIVLYLSLEKRFAADNLKKLRGKKFKISYFKAKKFAKLLKN